MSFLYIQIFLCTTVVKKTGNGANIPIRVWYLEVFMTVTVSLKPELCNKIVNNNKK